MYTGRQDAKTFQTTRLLLRLSIIHNLQNFFILFGFFVNTWSNCKQEAPGLQLKLLWSSCDYLKQLQAWRSTRLLLKLLWSSWSKRPQFLVGSHLYYYVVAPLLQNLEATRKHIETSAKVLFQILCHRRREKPKVFLHTSCCLRLLSRQLLTSNEKPAKNKEVRWFATTISIVDAGRE